MKCVLSPEDLESVNCNPAGAFLLVAERYPDALAIDRDGEKISNRVLAQDMMKFAGHMRDRGVGPGSTVALHLKGGALWVVMTMACWLIGAKWYKVNRAAIEMSAALQPTHLFSNLQDKLHLGISGYVIDRTWASVTPSQFPDKVSSQADDICFLATSSGTTGTPKVIPMTFRNMTRRFTSSRKIPGVELEERARISTFAGGSLGSVIGAGTALLSLAGNLISARPDYIQANAGTVISSLAGILKWVAAFAPGGRKIPLLRLGGSPVSDDILTDLLTHWFEMVVNVYGATEVGYIYVDAFTIMDGKLEWSQHVVEGMEIEIVACDADGCGDIRVRGDGLVDGYAGQAELSSDLFRNGWFYPGDKGFRDDRGRIHIEGRTDEVVNLAGVKVNLNRVDDALRTTPGIADAIAFLDADDQGRQKVSCVVQHVPDVGDNAASGQVMRQAVWRDCGRAAMPRRILVVQEVPRNANGKADRNKAHELALKAWADPACTLVGEGVWNVDM